MPAFQFDAKSRVGQRLRHSSFDFNGVFFRHYLSSTLRGFGESVRVGFTERQAPTASTIS